MTDSDVSGERPDSDDYDLLTYGEAAARLAELLAAERRSLAALRAAPDPDTDRIEQLQLRIALLESSDARFRQQSMSSEEFQRRFGVRPYKDSADSPTTRP